jgi:hypothetical protein
MVMNPPTGKPDVHTRTEKQLQLSYPSRRQVTMRRHTFQASTCREPTPESKKIFIKISRHRGTQRRITTNRRADYALTNKTIEPTLVTDSVLKMETVELPIVRNKLFFRNTLLWLACTDHDA